MELAKTYTVKMQSGDIWQFKYNLNGILIFFNVLDGHLSESQQKWLFLEGRFPWKENQIQGWPKLFKTATVEIGEPDLTFQTFWKMYPYNALSKKKIALERWDKLKESDRIKILMKIPEFVKLKTKENTSLPYAEVFINQRWWDQ